MSAKCKFAWAVWLLLSLFGTQLTWAQEVAPSDAGASSQPRIQVFIVGVPAWQEEKYKPSPLGDDIRETCGELLTFFKARFGEKQVEFHPDASDPCTPANTTYAAIRQLLYVDLPRYGQHTLTFLFMMSHGEIDQYDNSLVSQDLRFIASDTTEQNPEGTSISVGFELLNWLQKLGAGSTVLAFIDTCNAGSLDTLKLSIEHSVENFYGIRFGVVVASLSDKSAYQANFTKSLLDLWQGDRCDEQTFEDDLYERVKRKTTKITLDHGDGRPKVIARYGGGWCLNQLGATDRLLFAYQGSRDSVDWHLQDVEGKYESDAKYKRDFSISDAAFRLILVPPAIYSVTAKPDKGGPVRNFPRVDLLTQSTAPVFFERPATTKEVYAVFDTYRKYAHYLGISPDEAHNIDVLAKVARRQAFGAHQQHATGEPPVAAPVEVDPMGPDRATVLQERGAESLRKGDFRAASIALEGAASAAERADTRSDDAMAAYLAAGAAGDAAKAEKLRKKFDVSLGPHESEIVALEKAAKSTHSVETREAFKAASTVGLLTEFSELIVGGEAVAEVKPPAFPDRLLPKNDDQLD